jgi:hypothetical protein
VWVCVCVITSLCKGIVPFHGGGSAAARQRAPLARMHSKLCPSAAHHALPVSGQSSVVHVPLCRCVSCALCELRNSPRSQLNPTP